MSSFTHITKTTHINSTMQHCLLPSVPLFPQLVCFTLSPVSHSTGSPLHPASIHLLLANKGITANLIEQTQDRQPYTLQG